MSDYTTTIESRIEGIPCLLGVTHYHKTPPWSGSAHTAPSDLDYYGYEEVEFDVLDRRGRPAPWLEKKLTEAARKGLEETVLEYMSEHYND